MDNNMNNIRNQKISEIRSAWSHILALLSQISGIVVDLRGESDFGYIYSELMLKIAEAMRMIVEQMCKLLNEPYSNLDESLANIYSHENDPLAQGMMTENASQLFNSHAEETCRDSQSNNLYME